MTEIKGIVVEPILDNEDSEMYEDQVMSTEPIGDTDALPSPLPIPIPIPIPPTTKHYSELMQELHYYNYRGASLLRKMYNTTFATGIYVTTKMVVPGVWEIGETADYEVKVRNYTGFDLEDVKARLYVNPSGLATIVSPPGSYIKLGDIKYSANKTNTFKVKGVNGGDVTLALRIDGLMGSSKRRIYYNGRYWNGSAWVYKHPYQAKYHIYG
jgi:hypothetical protein